MKKALVLVGCVFGLLACSSGKLTPDAAQAQVKQLMALYTENRPKFVVQKQEMEQASDCGRATSLREAIDLLAKDAAMSTDNTQTVTLVQMELTQAEKTCLAK